MAANGVETAVNRSSVPRPTFGCEGQPGERRRFLVVTFEGEVAVIGGVYPKSRQPSSVSSLLVIVMK